jgi:ribosomal protein S18 acetylase RimI-like enzyme
MKSIDIEYTVLDLKEFTGRMQGHDKEYNRCPVSLEMGDIKYYDGVPYSMSNKELEYYFVIATVKAKSKNYKKLMVDKVIGMVELQKSPYDPEVLWLDFISVDPKYKNQGIGRKLSEMMVSFLEGKPWKLERSTPSDDGIKYIKSIIDDLLEKHKIVTIPRMKM